MVGRAVLGEPLRLGGTPRPTFFPWLTRRELDDLFKRRHDRINQNELNESNTRAIRALFGKSSNRTNRLPAAAVVGVLAEVARIEVEATRFDRTARMRR